MAVFSNRATLTYNGITTDSNVVTGEIIEVLSAVKEAIGDTYCPDESVTYVIGLVNTGTLPYTALTVTDDLGAYPFGSSTLVPLDYVEGSARIFVNGTEVPAPTVTTGNPLTFSGISVPAGGNAVLIYRARPNAFAPRAAGGSIQNTATVTGGGLSAALTASKTISVGTCSSLSITKTLTPTQIPENGEITYTFVISNFGNTPIVATDNASVKDVFDPILSDVTVTLDGIPLAEGVGYSYNTTSGVFETLAGALPIPAATFTQDPVTGEWTTTPGQTVLTVTGRV